MLKNMLLFGEVGERIIGLVYDGLAERFEEGSERRAVLLQLAEEERAHGRALQRILEVSPAEHEGYDYGMIFAGQAAFIGSCVDLLSGIRDPSTDHSAALERLVEMERSLSENLFVHLKLLVAEDHRQSMRQLAETSAEHAERLAAVV
jgi:rubrerythrin